MQNNKNKSRPFPRGTMPHGKDFSTPFISTASHGVAWKERDKIIIYTDGGARGNPGQAALGVVIQDAEGHTIKSWGTAIGVATNNDAEYQAVVAALQKAKALIGGKKAKETSVDMRMDSQLVCRQLNGEYKIEEERFFPYFMKIWNLKMDFARVTFAHIPREKNKGADTEVNRALDNNRAQSVFAI